MRTLRLLLALVTLLVPAGALAAPKSTGAAPGGQRLRPSDGRVAALLLDGLDRSPTLRAIVNRIEQGDVIVYLETQPLLKRNHLSGVLTWLSAAPPFRYVRISLNPELSRASAIASLGHELQHALEVLDEPSIVDPVSLEAFYVKNGISMPGHLNGWDSNKARNVGDEVRRDLSGGRASRAAETAGDYDPRVWAADSRQARQHAR